MTHAATTRAELLRRNKILDAADAAEKQRAGRVVDPSVRWIDSDLGVLWPWAGGSMAMAAYDPFEVLECAEVATLMVVEAEASVLVYGDVDSLADLAQAKELADKFTTAARAFFAPHVHRLVTLGLCRASGQARGGCRTNP